jgi:3-hydroxyisobutyrate dehydrogenase-like beta-hydroxyacid dehydrogenase
MKIDHGQVPIASGEDTLRIGFIGLGQMGRAMAGRLLEAGHELAVYNRSPAAAEPFRARGARIACSAQETLDADVVVTMLADDAALEAVWQGAGLVARMPASAIHLNMGTVSLDMGRRMAKLHAAAGVGYVAAPVFGRPHVAATGELDIIAAGSAAAIERCRPLFGALGSRTFVVGAEPHLANAVKIARNFLLASLVESLGEALALVRKCGVDPAVFLDVITSSSFDRRYRDYGRRMVEGDFEPAFLLSLGLKDVELALAAAAVSGVRLPTAALLREQHVAAIADGFGEKDWAALGEFIAQRSGLAR